MLLDGRELWLSLHSVEPEVLSRLGRETVPVDEFATPAGIAAYLRAAEGAAAMLGRTLGADVRWIHPLPQGPGAPSAMATLGAGAGLDLDSYLTLLPGRRALVASLGAGMAAIQRAPAADLDSVATFFELGVRGEALKSRLLDAATGPSNAALENYLEVVARHLASAGLEVACMPCADSDDPVPRPRGRRLRRVLPDLEQPGPRTDRRRLPGGGLRGWPSPPPTGRSRRCSPRAGSPGRACRRCAAASSSAAAIAAHRTTSDDRRGRLERGSGVLTSARFVSVRP